MQPSETSDSDRDVQRGREAARTPFDIGLSAMPTPRSHNKLHPLAVTARLCVFVGAVLTMASLAYAVRVGMLLGGWVALGSAVVPVSLGVLIVMVGSIASVYAHHEERGMNGEKRGSSI
jgi:hypothetical protein